MAAAAGLDWEATQAVGREVLQRRVVQMDGVVARDPRVAAILTRPDDYFDRARARAWVAAARDIRADLGRRQTRRREPGREDPGAADPGRR